ncbi:hypothetical protein MPNT_200035 [Candidatus Methylacidithermus pantelleriae]|uniref:Uncharacterized protein n=1 Tax=Candidatus Methylacidithermus pantelleriae TaxID=2744239 RepID=A0A8J2BPL6_9BACT|nr:hypothetical protein MPNT_200035 [Candidatus Methylacidithermus pantelleriae]
MELSTGGSLRSSRASTAAGPKSFACLAPSRRRIAIVVEPQEADSRESRPRE